MAWGPKVWRNLDRVVIYGLCWRVWQTAAVPVTLLLVSLNFTPQLQGYYYTFASIIALQSFFELGLYLVVVNIAAHEWADLSLTATGQIAGKPHARSRLISLGRFIFKYYTLAALLFFAVVGPVGWLLFSGRIVGGVTWHGPWLAMVAIAATKLVAEPFCSLLEGCNQIHAVYQMRLVQSVVSSLAGWAAILAGWELWVPVAVSALQLGATLLFLLGRYGNFFRAFLRPTDGPRLGWRKDIWPMQWRLACSGLLNYFAYSLFNPVIFYFNGPVAAGQMGMTLQVVGGVQTVALTWLTVKVPQFGALIARREFRRLDELWRTASWMSLGSFLVGGSLLVLVVALCGHFHVAMAERILPMSALIGLLVGGVATNVGQSLTAYLRAHRQEPILVMSVVTALLSGTSVLLLAYLSGPGAIAWGYATVIVFGLAWEWAIWERCRREWHGELPLPASAS